ncbi:MAG: DUF86 domain-containing protein [Thermodesulfobacteriota bacterium]|nr:DUF86 domain-containing protein [Thermodesulfobacteriota bacterium]
MRIRKYTDGLTEETFSKNDLIQDDVIRNLGIIGEAAGKLPEELRQQGKDIEWRKIIAMRNILIREYFSVDGHIIWDIIVNKLPALKRCVEALR